MITSPVPLVCGVVKSPDFVLDIGDDGPEAVTDPDAGRHGAREDGRQDDEGAGHRDDLKGGEDAQDSGQGVQASEQGSAHEAGRQGDQQEGRGGGHGS